jgi:hypothetical protein
MACVLLQKSPVRNLRLVGTETCHEHSTRVVHQIKPARLDAVFETRAADLRLGVEQTTAGGGLTVDSLAQLLR